MKPLQYIILPLRAWISFHQRICKMEDRKLSITELKRLSPEEYVQSKRLPMVVMLDNIRSAQNVGAIFRTADAFRVSEILLVGITPIPPHPLIHKTALGAEEVVPFKYYATCEEAVRRYRERGYEVWCLEQTAQSIPLSRSHLLGRRVLLVAGNEVHGVSDEVVRLADRSVEIPQYGTKHSLNVSVSVGIALHHLLLPFFESIE